MASIAYIADKKMIEFHRINGNRTMNFWRPSNSKKFTDFQEGDLLFFLAKGTERGKHREKGIVGYGRFDKMQSLSFKQMWKEYETENGYQSESELYEAISKVSKNKKVPKHMNCIYLIDVIFFQSPIYLSELGVHISNKVESYIYMDKDDPQATSKVLNKAKEGGIDMWTVAMSTDYSSQNSTFEVEEIKHQISLIYAKITGSCYSEVEARKAYRVMKNFIRDNIEAGFEFIKGSKDDCVSYEESKIIVALPLLYNSKDRGKKIQFMLGRIECYKRLFQNDCSYNIPLIFMVISEHEAPRDSEKLLELFEN